MQYAQNKVKQLSIESFDAQTLNYQSSKSIDLPKSSKFELLPDQVVQVNGHLILLCFRFYKKSASKVIGAYQILKNGSLSSFVRLDSISNVGEIDESLYHIVQDKSEKSFLFVVNKISQRNTEQVIDIKKLDQNLTTIWNIQKPLSGLKNQLQFYNLVFDGHERLYMLAKKKMAKGREFTDRVIKNNKYHVWCINTKSERIKQIELTLNQKWIFDTKLCLNQDSSCTVAGIYSNSTGNTINGLITIRVSKDFNMQSNALLPFSSHTLKSIHLKNKTAIPNILLRSVLPVDSGKIVVLCEQYSKDIEEYYDPQTEAISYTDVFHYNHLVVTWIDSNSSKISEFGIQKNQVSSNDGGLYSSFTPMISNDTLSLFYNDNSKNNKTKLDHIKTARTGTIFVSPYRLKLTSNQLISKTKIASKLEINLIPKNSFQTHPNKDCYLVFEHNNRNQIAKYSIITD